MGKLSWSGVVDAGRPTFLVSRIAAGEVCSPVRTMQAAVSGQRRAECRRAAACRAPPVRLVGQSVAHDGRLCHTC